MKAKVVLPGPLMGGIPEIMKIMEVHKIKVTETEIKADLKKGKFTLKAGKINIIEYLAWLLKELAGHD